ncbi:hypothetical protein [Streptomyces sp. CA-179760]|uniref:hypothetical protein n=1 Tax=Streptomyces sp. CA-179760 TaxID=3240054 RepID=UPI003D8FC052
MKGAPGAGAGAGGVNGAPGAGGGAGGVKGAPGAGAGAGAEDGPEACPGRDEVPPEAFACGGGVSPGSGGTGPFGTPEAPVGAPEPPEFAGAPEALESSDAPAPCPELELAEAFCVYQAGGA